MLCPVTGQRDTELTQLSNDQANSETSAKNSVVNSEGEFVCYRAFCLKTDHIMSMWY